QPRRSSAGHLSLRTAHRRSRRGGALPARLAARLAHGCGQARSVARKLAASTLISLDRISRRRRGSNWFDPPPRDCDFRAIPLATPARPNPAREKAAPKKTSGPPFLPKTKLPCIPPPPTRPP